MSSNKVVLMWTLLALALTISFSGCAAAYHDYPGCCIPYAYCPAPPLPYVAYEECRCSTPVASQYFEERGAATGIAIPDADVSGEASIP